MKIDLHCHTKQIKSGDGEKRNVTPEVFREKISNADIGIVAITNHNAFDYEQYIALRDAVSDICAVWPGVEIDIQGSNGKKFHLIVVANPERAQDFSVGVSELFRGMNLETCKLDLQQVYDKLNEFDVVFCYFSKNSEMMLMLIFLMSQNLAWVTLISIQIFVR